MNEDSGGSVMSTAEQELLMEGCKSYLEVIHATNAFQTHLCNAACDVINAARDRIYQIAKLETPLETLANAFVDPAAPDSTFTGSQAWVGATLWLDKPVWANLYLALVFDGDSTSGQQTAHVCFALQAHQKYVLRQLAELFRGHQDCEVYDDWDWLAVELRRPLENPLRVSEELSTMLDRALTQWNT